MGLSNLSFSATNISAGNDADKPVNPQPGAQYVAVDTKKLYVCYIEGSWENPVDISETISEYRQLYYVQSATVTSYESTTTPTQTAKTTFPGKLIASAHGVSSYVTVELYYNGSVIWTGNGGDSSNIEQTINAGDEIYLYVKANDSSNDNYGRLTIYGRDKSVSINGTVVEDITATV